MLATFLSRDFEAEELFEDLNIANDKEAMQHLGAHDVIYIDFSFQGNEKITYLEYISIIKNGILRDLDSMFPNLGL